METIGFIGLGRMGANMVRRLIRDGHEVVVYNRTPEKTTEIAGEGADVVCEAVGKPITRLTTRRPPSGQPIRHRLRNFRPDAGSYLASLGGPLPYMQRLREIERTWRYLPEYERLDEIIAKHTGQDLEKVAKDTERDYFMSAEEAKEYKLVDRVIEHR